MHIEVREAIDKCTRCCSTCKPGKWGFPTREECSTLQCIPQQEVIKIAMKYGENI